MNAFLASLPELQDAETVGWLYSSFGTNQEGDDAKMSFWKRTILAAVEHGHLGRGVFLASVDPSFSLRFECKGVSPLCLDAVVRKLLEEKKLMIKQEKTEGLGMFKEALSLLRSFFAPREMASRPFNIYSSDKLHNTLRALVEKRQKNGTFLVEDLKDALNKEFPNATDEDGALLIEEAERTYKNAADAGGQIFFVGESTDASLGLARLRRSERKLQNKLEEGAADMMAANQKIRKYHSSGMKDLAISELKKAKMKEQEMKRTNDMLSKIEEITHTIQTSLGNKEIHRAMEEAARLVKKTLPDPSSVEEAVDEIKEAFDATTEISSLLSESLFIGSDGLEEELAILMSSQQEAPHTHVTSTKDSSLESSKVEGSPLLDDGRV
eukprot:GHVN01098874.1.p3 GENE.GHVN01098874.1~~GHVN01098874.1.p3  ORF type:complete len:382 (-),score=76.62 GHVN01098874.1:2369-3514(-)